MGSVKTSMSSFLYYFFFRKWILLFILVQLEREEEEEGNQGKVGEEWTWISPYLLVFHHNNREEDNAKFMLEIVKPKIICTWQKFIGASGSIYCEDIASSLFGIRWIGYAFVYLSVSLCVSFSRFVMKCQSCVNRDALICALKDQNNSFVDIYWHHGCFCMDCFINNTYNCVRVQEHGGEIIIPFSGALERNLADMPPDEAAKYCEENKLQRLVDAISSFC